MRKIHSKNGFEFVCDKHFFGEWVYDWSYRPIGKTEWISFNLPLARAKKQDLVDFLGDRDNALKTYEEKIIYLSDVERAKKDLEMCQSRLEKFEAPDWGGRGNNPDKDQRRIRDARMDVSSEKDSLARAISLRERLSKEQ